MKYLPRALFDIHLITLSPEPSQSRWYEFESLEIGLESLELGRLSGLFIARGRLQKRVESLQPDLIHSQGIRPDMLVAKLHLTVPKVSTIRNIPQIDYPMKYGRVLGQIMAILHRSVLKHFTACVGVSSAVSENVRKRAGEATVHTIQNGVDTERYTECQPSSQEEHKQRLGFHPVRPLGVSVGSLIERKDPCVIIRAFAKIREAGWTMVLLGDGPLMPECRRMVRQTDNILLMGNVENVHEYLCAADLFVSASHSEGLPNSVLEAMACKVPVLLSDIQPHRELLPQSYYDELLFEVGNEDMLCQKIMELFSRNLKKYGADISYRMRNTFSAEAVSEKYRALYSQLISSNR